MARQRNVKFVIGSSLNAGFISGSPRYNYGKTSWDIPRQYIEKRERLRAVAAQFGADLRTAALQFSAAPDVAAASRIGWRAASLHGHVPGNLLHPPLVRVNGNAGDLHPSARHQVHPVVPSDHASGRVEPLVLPARSPNLNAYAERWVRSVKEECLSKVILFGERSLRRARANMSNISIASGITKGGAMCCCSLGVRTSAATGLFNAASDWADSCVITIRRQGERERRLR